MVLKSPLERTQAFSTPRKPTVEIPASNVEDALKYIKENASGGLASVEDDPAPKLGGDLDLNGHHITGLQIGTDVQAYSSNLDSWSLVAPGSYLTVAAAAAGYQPLNANLTTWASLEPSVNAQSLVTATDYSAMRTLLGLVIGTNVQAYDADLTTWAGLTPSANFQTMVSHTFSQMRTDLGLGTAAVAAATDFATAAQGATADSALQASDIGITVQAHAANLDTWATKTAPSGTVVGTSDSQVLTSKTFDTAGAGNVLKVNGTQISDKTGTGKVVLDTSPALSNPTVGTQSARDNSTKAASTAYVDRTTREVLAANRTYYVRTDGSDSNNGLSNTSGGAFGSIQKAIDVAAALDISIYDVTIQLGNTGTYVGGILKYPTGTGTLKIVGNTGSPSSYVITKSGVWCFQTGTFGKFSLSGMQFNDSSANGLIDCATPGAALTLTNNDYGAAINFAIVAENGSFVTVSGSNNKISASSLAAFFVTQSLGQISTSPAPTFTLQNNLTISNAFMLARWNSLGFMPIITFTLGSFSVTGIRYNVTDNSAVITGGAGASYFPGSSSGTTSTGGQYS